MRVAVGAPGPRGGHRGQAWPGLEVVEPLIWGTGSVAPQLSHSPPRLSEVEGGVNLAKGRVGSAWFFLGGCLCSGMPELKHVRPPFPWRGFGVCGAHSPPRLSEVEGGISLAKGRMGSAWLLGCRACAPAGWSSCASAHTSPAPGSAVGKGFALRSGGWAPLGFGWRCLCSGWAGAGALPHPPIPLLRVAEVGSGLPSLPAELPALMSLVSTSLPPVSLLLRASKLRSSMRTAVFGFHFLSFS